MEVSVSSTSQEPHIPTVSASTSFAGLLYEFGENLKKRISVCTPAIVYDYESATGTAYVRPLVSEQEDSGAIRMQPLLRVTVLQHQSGGFFIHNPLLVGDTGWLIAADTDTDLVKERNSFIQGAVSGIGNREQSTGKPISNQGPQISENDVRHELSQGFFIPDKWGGVQIPGEFRNSLIIQQVAPDSTSHGRFVLDPNGTIHLISTRWQGEDKKLYGGCIDVDLRFKGIDPINNTPYWEAGEINTLANAIIQGDIEIKAWTDEFGKRHGGHLVVEDSISVGKDIAVKGNAQIDGNLEVKSGTQFKNRVVVKTDNKAAIIDPKQDLYKTDAKFREVLVVTGLKEQKDSKVKFKTQKMRVLSDVPENGKDVEIEVKGGAVEGGSGVAFNGTDNKWGDESDRFLLRSQVDSNMKITCNGTYIYIGAYYL